MFENLVAGSIEPEIIKLLRSVKQALEGVEHRLVEQVESGDPVTVLSASTQLSALHAWAPGINDVLKSLEPKPPTVTALRVPPGHGH